nr:hypothetical protein [uncultured Mediterranean phage uvMED]
MVTFNPFMQSATAQDIISNYINKPYEKPPAINPIFDLREEGQEFPPLNPPVQTDPVVDPCPPGYQLIDGVCQPIDQFGGDMTENTVGEGFEDDRPYFSIDAMRDLSNEDLLDYLKSGFLSNSPIGFLPSRGNLVTLKDSLPSLQGSLLQLPFGNQSELRKKAMENELMRRGYFSGQYDDSGDFIFDIAGTPDNSYLFTPKATTDEGDVSYGGNIIATMPSGKDVYATTNVEGSYGGGEDFGSPFTSDYKGNVVVNNQQVQQQNQAARKRYDEMFGEDAGI